MAHPIKELAKLTTKSKQIDGMGFGGEAPDNLEVAGTLAMANPNTGRKLNRHAYYLGRYAYCGDERMRAQLRAGILGELQAIDTGSIKDITLLKMVNAALREFINPKYKTDRYGKTLSDKDGEPIIEPITGREFARRLGMAHQSVTRNHEDVYSAIFDVICALNSEVLGHIKAHSEKAA